ncbi:ash family protein [Aeromonas hydrophila]|uniref:ash family protein n=1 Tax=Aeromonas hydrophila TaxID=644 RepID=UPI002B49C0DE|nr:ash family protein [Aeromonas hydrophila]
MHHSKAPDPQQELHPWINSDSLYFATAKSVAEIGVSKTNKEPTHAPIAWFFVGIRSPFLRVLLTYLVGGALRVMAVRTRAPQGALGSLLTSYANLVRAATSWRLASSGGRENLLNKEAAIMATFPTLATSKIFTFLLAPRSCRVAELRRPRTVSTIACTEGEARAHLPGLPLVFLSQRPAMGVAA